jgi:hypothetical protein
MKARAQYQALGCGVKDAECLGRGETLRTLSEIT